MGDMDEIAFDSAAAILEMRKRQLSIGLRLQAVGVAALEELERKMAAGEPLGLSRQDAEKLRDTGVEMERAALKETNGDPPDSIKKPN